MTTKILTGLYLATYNLTSPVTTLSISTTGYLYGGLVATGAGGYSIVNHGGILGDAYGIELAGENSITNTGTVLATGTAGVGVYLKDGGTVTNGAAGAVSALIAGRKGVLVAANSGVVTNFGDIEGVVRAVEFDSGAGTVVNYGVMRAALAVVGDLELGGMLTNGSDTDTEALIQGGSGFIIRNGAGTANNFGTIAAVSPTGGSFGLDIFGGVVNNGDAGDTKALIKGAYAVAATHAAGTVSNFGIIGEPASYFGVLLEFGGSVVNGSTADTAALIQGATGVAVTASSATIRNYGSIVGLGGGTITAGGVVLYEGGEVTNGSVADTAALLQGYSGVYAKGAAATVINFGTISDQPATRGVGVYLASGGRIVNGSSTDTAALIQGRAAVIVKGGSGSISNFGTIRAALLNGVGAELGGGGSVINGSNTDTTALITGELGVLIEFTAGTVINDGTISATQIKGTDGVEIISGGTLTNGANTIRSALISGYIGALLGGGVTGTNFGTIAGFGGGPDGFGIEIEGGKLTNGSATDQTALITGANGAIVFDASTLNNFGTVAGTGTAGIAVELTDTTSRLNAEAGSVFTGTILSGVGVVDFVGGVSTATALQSGGTVTGAGTVALNGGKSTFQSGTKLTVAHISVAGAATEVDVATTLTYGKVWTQTAGLLSVASPYQMTFSGTGDSFSGTIGGTGTVVFSGGTDTLANVTLSATHMAINTAAVTLQGTIDLTTTLTATTTALTIAAGGATLSGGGVLSLSNKATNKIIGASASATLTNGDKITGAGNLGGGSLTLVNQKGGLINANLAAALTIDTGAKVVTNAGVIQNTGAGGLLIKGGVTNTGTLAVTAGTMTVGGAVGGAGVARIGGGTLFFEAAFTENVTFTGATGVLELAHGQTYTGSITGFSKAGTTSLDLNDITYAAGTTTATFSGTTAGGTLTVTDGTHTAHIKFVGDYTASAFVTASDGHGGTIIHDPTKSATITPLATTHAFAGAMAGFASRGASGSSGVETWRGTVAALAAPRAHPA